MEEDLKKSQEDPEDTYQSYEYTETVKPSREAAGRGG